MQEKKLNELLEAGALATLLENAKALAPLIEALRDNEEQVETPRNNGEKKNPIVWHDKCCCPLWLKFKFFFCRVEIENENAECRKNLPRPVL